MPGSHPRHHSTFSHYISLGLFLTLFLAFAVFDGFKEYRSSIQGFPGGSVIKNLPATAEDAGLNQEDPLEKEVGTCSSIFAWKTPWTQGAGWLRSMGSQRVEYN